MSKSVLVMDTPETCGDCQFCYELDEGVKACCTLIGDEKGLMKEIDCEDGYCQDKPNWCPLKELPEEDNAYGYLDEWSDGYTDGWNNCLVEITSQFKENH